MPLEFSEPFSYEEKSFSFSSILLKISCFELFSASISFFSSSAFSGEISAVGCSASSMLFLSDSASPFFAAIFCSSASAFEIQNSSFLTNISSISPPSESLRVSLRLSSSSFSDSISRSFCAFRISCSESIIFLSSEYRFSSSLISVSSCFASFSVTARFFLCSSQLFNLPLSSESRARFLISLPTLPLFDTRSNRASSSLSSTVWYEVSSSPVTAMFESLALISPSAAESDSVAPN